MPCKNHPEVESVARCAGCQESFCSNCLVEIKGQKYCGSCKVMAIEDKAPPVLESRGMKPCAEANEALRYAIIGIFCFGIILGPIAISKGNAAKRLIEADPELTGTGKANAAIAIGIITILLWILGIISRAASI